MKFNLSLKKTWYSLILLVAIVPVLLMLAWGGSLYYKLLLEKHLLEEEFFRELAVNHVKQEILRLTTLLENKSDPMAYTLARDRDDQLLNELLHKVVNRESTIHMLLIIGADGQVIKGVEPHTRHFSMPDKHSEMMKHWQYRAGNLPVAVTESLKGRNYISPVSFHPEGVFFNISVPVGPAEYPLAVLLAYVDANILWQDIQPHLQRAMVASYLVDTKGLLLTLPANAQYSLGDSVMHLPVVKALITRQEWQHDQAYKGLKGQQVFGSLSQVDDIGLGIITEADYEYVLHPIHKLLFKLVMGAAIVIALLLWLGIRVFKPVVKSIDAISADFTRVGKQDYTASTILSSFEELQTLVDCFNHMVREIDHNHQDLQQAAIVFKNTSEGIIITDTEQRIVSVNRAFSKITGYKKDEVLGKNPSILSSGRHDDAFYASMWHSIEGTGKWYGEIWNRRKNGEVYAELLNINTFRDAHGKLTYRIGVFNDISNIKEVENKLEYLAHHDPLTNLPNRLLCHARMEHELQIAKRNKDQVAILFLDLDMFKNINDSMGHAKGDLLLQQVAERINESIRDEDTIARLGGDEFVIIIGALKNRRDAALIAENTLSLFLNPFFIDEQDIFIGGSIGISVYPDDGENPDMLLRNADAAMYRAKSQGRNNYQFYTPALTENASERLNIENNLRHALKKNEFSVYYQPQYSLSSEQIIGVEALLRWNHPEMGMVEPDKFIPVAEEMGLIVPIGEWVLKTACKQQKKWIDAGCPSMRIAVNLSARQFWKPGLEKVIENIMEETEINPEDLELELTESIIMHDTLTVSDTLNALHHMGVGLSIDDFGTGYSSLSYIQRFPLDRLKIDRSFVSDIMTNPADAEMIVSIIALGHCMNLQIVAEGVETKEQLLFLREHGCEEVQGFYFSQPIPAIEMEALLSSSSF